MSCQKSSFKLAFIWKNDHFKSLLQKETFFLEEDVSAPMPGHSFKLKMSFNKGSNVKIHLKYSGVGRTNIEHVSVTFTNKSSSKFKSDILDRSFIAIPGREIEIADFDWIINSKSVIAVKFNVQIDEQFCTKKNEKWFSYGGIFSDLEKEFKNPKMSDFTLVCEGERLSCHRLILGARSPVFAQMFSNSAFKENQTNEMLVGDTSPEILKLFLTYLYTDVLDGDIENTSRLLELAEKYQITSMKKKCEDFLAENVTVENAARLFKLSSLYNTKLLKSEVLKIISSQRQAFVKTEGWAELKTDQNSKPLLVEMIEYVE